MKRLALLLPLAACAGTGAATPESSAGSAVSADAPGWARQGDATNDLGHRFICEGEGNTEEVALNTARAICDDKICKLCGVEIESVVETSETLTGIEMERKVIERCRRVRKEDTELQRKSVDCGPAGCLAWIQIDYSKARQKQECTRLTDENFADPEACQTLIESFKSVEGFTAESLRRRVSLLEEARTACAEIDVRPTPLMQSLEEKLRLGMGSIRRAAPSHLRNHWLASFPPMWEQYKQSPKFTQRLDLLLGYLRSKVPLLDVIEATYINDETLDTAASLANLFAKMKAAPKEKAYGVKFVQMIAVAHIARNAVRGRLTQSLEAINAWIQHEYTPDMIEAWSHVVAMIDLFSSDGTITANEWNWASGLSRWRTRCWQELLRVPKQSGGKRTARALEAITRRRAEKPKEKAARVLELALPSRTPDLFLAIESSLPEELQKSISWDLLEKQLPSWDAWQPMKNRVRLLKRMRRALIDDPVENRLCLDLYKRLELLDSYGVSTAGLADPICDCLEGPLQKTATLNSGNKAPLYERAMKEELSCVLPR